MYSKLLLVLFSVHCITGLLDGLQDVSTNQRLDDMAMEIQELKQKVAVLETQSSSGGPVAFMASLSSTLSNVGQHQHIVFDNVITNVGGGYHSSSGHFTAPVAGVYAFYVSLTNIPQHSASVVLYRNGKWIGHVLAHGSATNSGLYVTSTLPSVVQLEAGDEVWVQNEHAFSNVEEIDGGNWSYFTGHLVQAS